MALITLLAPILLEIIKIFFSKSSDEQKQAAANEIRATLAKIRAATQKAEDTGGDTSDLEDVINGKK